MSNGWIELIDLNQLEEIKKKSFELPQLIFKHSTRCSISSVALRRMETKKIPQPVNYYLLDLLRYRDISHQITEVFGVYHESPQVLLIRNGECIYDESHLSIDPTEIEEQAR